MTIRDGALGTHWAASSGLYRMRWQIEWVFKRRKSLTQLGHLLEA